MYKWIPAARRILRLIYQFIYSILLFDIGVALFSQPRGNVRQFLILLGVLVVSYLFREWCSRGIIYLIPHVVMGVVIYFLPEELYIRIIMMIFTTGYFIDGMYYISRGFKLTRAFDLPWGSAALGIGAIMLGNHQHFPDVVRLGTILPMVTISIFLISLYLEGLDTYINSAKYVSGAPLKQIASVNSLIVACIMLMIYAVILICELMNVQIVLVGLGKAFLAILRIIVIIVYIIFSFIMGLFLGGLPTYSGGVDEIKDIADESGLLGNILNFLIFAAVTAFVIVSIYRFFKWLIAFLLQKNLHENEVSENLPKAKKNQITVEKVPFRETLIGNSPDIKARRIYKRKVRSYKFSFVPDKNSTAGDIRLLMQTAGEGYSWDQSKTPEERSADMTERTNELTELYERVRYGEEMPDKQFLTRMKKL